MCGPDQVRIYLDPLLLTLLAVGCWLLAAAGCVYRLPRCEIDCRLTRSGEAVIRPI